MRSKIFRRRQAPSAVEGQALLIVILVMAVVLTIALSLVSRTISDINISTKEDDSSRAFSAAEAGIEQALLNKSTGTYTLNGNVTSQDSFSVNATPLVSGGNEFSVPLLLSAGETAPVWLVEHADDGSLTCSLTKPCFTGSQLKVCWGESGTPDSATSPAVEATVVYLTSDTDLSTARIARAAFDPIVSRTDVNNFTKGSEGTNCTVQGKSYQYSKTIDLAALGVTIRGNAAQRRGPQYLRVRMLYNTDQAHPIGVNVAGAGMFPLQGSKVISQGTSGTATRSLEVSQLFPDLPPIFDSVVFSGSGGIVK